MKTSKELDEVGRLYPKEWKRAKERRDELEAESGKVLRILDVKIAATGDYVVFVASAYDDAEWQRIVRAINANDEHVEPAPDPIMIVVTSKRAVN